MKNMKIGARIIAGFAAVISLSICLGVFAFTRLSTIEASAHIVADNNYPSVLLLSRVPFRAQSIQTLLLLHGASSSAEEMTSLEGQMQALREANNRDMQGYEALPSSDEERALYAKATAAKIKYWNTADQMLKVSRIGTPQANARALQIFTEQLRPQGDVYISSVQDLLNFNSDSATAELKQVTAMVKAADRAIVVGLVISILLAAPIIFFIVQGISRPLAAAVSVLEQVAEGDLTAHLAVDSKDEVGLMARALNEAIEKLRSTLEEVASTASNTTSSSHELAAAAEAIASGAQEQAASLEQTSASLEEITATVRQSADNARQASQIASSSKESAEGGQIVVSTAIAAMAEINTASARISDIISTIDEIAFQTNLLAVNAAVEAARAGEEGRGFSVVASEVRSLAQRSAGAAKEIKALIQDSLRKVEKGTELVNRSGETLQGIVSSVKRVTDIVGEMAAAANEQSTGVEQVNTATTQMDRVTQSNAAQTEQMSSTAQSLAGQSSRLMELVSTFRLGKSVRQEQRGHAAGAGSATQAQQAVLSRRNGGLKGFPPKQAPSAASGPQGLRQPVLAMAGSNGDDGSFEEF